MGKVLEWVGKFLLLPLLKDLISYLSDRWKEYQQAKAEVVEAEKKLIESKKAYEELKKAQSEKEAIDAINKLP